MTQTHSSAFNVSSVPVLSNIIRLCVLAVISLSFLSCGEPPEEEVSPSDLVRSWTEVTNGAAFSARNAHTSAVFGGELWVIGGFDSSYKNDVWKSTDGKNWNKVTTAGTFFPHGVLILPRCLGVRTIPKMRCGSSAAMTRYERTMCGKAPTAVTGHSHTSAVFDNALWVIGGRDGSYKNDVWKSTDGINWTRVTAAAGFTGRESHTATVFGGALWIIGGNDGSFKNDVWKSTDGKYLDKVKDSMPTAVFPDRESHTPRCLTMRCGLSAAMTVP
ncbi:hypothetical protein CHS0354_006829 [Potamilus streckersoni]|uniref:Galactose oxidase n=1 Tax=Potamilus streckersoni TaxID=2493646 RepID=A0AAE0WB44_9BIVA|nr:hypothetical protein CHS0354_006829 [Potamilus streckersoni]